MKNKFRSLALLTAVGLLVPASLHAQSNNVFGHLVDTQWYGLSGEYSSIEVTITPEVGNEDYYYFANDVYFRNCSGNECLAYAGLQTNGYDGSAWIGKMAIFSIWNATQGLAEPGGKGTSFGGEGVGYSVRIPYQWQTGTGYRLKIYLDADGPSKLWAASITNLSSGSVSRIGRIYAPAGHGLIYNPITFHERYGGPSATCQTVTPSQVRFSNMTANNGAVKSTSWNHYYKASLPGCPNFWQKNEGDGFVSAIGTNPPVSSPTASPTLKKISPTPTPPVAATENPITKPPAETIANTQSTAPTLPQTKTNYHGWVIIFGGSSLFLIGLTGLFYFKNHKRQAYLRKHFPFDPDIHKLT